MTDPRIKRPCPFCNEAVHLSYQESSCPWPIVVDGDTERDENGYDIYDYVDGVGCMVCHALVPLIAWNREITSEVLAVIRQIEIDAPELEAA